VHDWYQAIVEHRSIRSVARPARSFDRRVASSTSRLEEFFQPTRPWQMPMDAYRRGDEFVVHLDVPGVNPSTIDLTPPNPIGVGT